MKPNKRNRCVITYVNNTCQSNGIKVKFTKTISKPNDDVALFSIHLSMSKGKKKISYFGKSNNLKVAKIRACVTALDDKFLKKFSENPHNSCQQHQPIIVQPTISEYEMNQLKKQKIEEQQKTRPTIENYQNNSSTGAQPFVKPVSNNQIYDLYLTSRLLNTNIKIEFAGLIKGEFETILIKLKYGKFRSLGTGRTDLEAIQTGAANMKFDNEFQIDSNDKILVDSLATLQQLHLSTGKKLESNCLMSIDFREPMFIWKVKYDQFIGYGISDCKSKSQLLAATRVLNQHTKINLQEPLNCQILFNQPDRHESRDQPNHQVSFDQPYDQEQVDQSKNSSNIENFDEISSNYDLNNYSPLFSPVYGSTDTEHSQKNSDFEEDNLSEVYIKHEKIDFEEDNLIDVDIKHEVDFG